ncbi:epimerase [Microbacterium sp. E-13]|uniref:epimerase n=1 Tax=Microbacterium sp. E-13 TaxID=3404048 RepID=UPI003CE7B629
MSTSASSIPSPRPSRDAGARVSRPVAVVAGASGFVGYALVQAFREDGCEVRTIGRADADASWGDGRGIRDLVDGAAIVVNLAGKSVNCRYTDANRDEILRSRVRTTRELREAITAATTPPAVWMNASTATIYRYALDRPQTETAGELGTGFSVDVARTWEDEFFAGELGATRRVALRMAIVLGDGPATRTLVRLARIGLGGPQHDGWWFPHRRYRGIGPHPTGEARAPWHRSHGRQRFSWIHIDDVVGAVRFLRDHPAITGPVNLSAPHASDNSRLMAALRRTVGAPVGLPAWRFMLEPAMWALRTEPELVLKSRWVVPETLTTAGYEFAHRDLERALREVFAALG